MSAETLSPKHRSEGKRQLSLDDLSSAVCEICGKRGYGHSEADHTFVFSATDQDAGYRPQDLNEHAVDLGEGEADTVPEYFLTGPDKIRLQREFRAIKENGRDVQYLKYCLNCKQSWEPNDHLSPSLQQPIDATSHTKSLWELTDDTWPKPPSADPNQCSRGEAHNLIIVNEEDAVFTDVNGSSSNISPDSDSRRPKSSSTAPNMGSRYRPESLASSLGGRSPGTLGPADFATGEWTLGPDGLYYPKD